MHTYTRLAFSDILDMYMEVRRKPDGEKRRGVYMYMIYLFIVVCFQHPHHELLYVFELVGRVLCTERYIVRLMACVYSHLEIHVLISMVFRVGKSVWDGKTVSHLSKCPQIMYMYMYYIVAYTMLSNCTTFSSYTL